MLERLGIDVEFPRDQTCCGQMHMNAGYADDALALAERFVQVFAGHEVVVTPSGSCAAHVRVHYPELLGDAAAGVPERVLELSELLSGPGIGDVGATWSGTVAYHPTCHSLRLLAPRRHA